MKIFVNVMYYVHYNISAAVALNMFILCQITAQIWIKCTSLTNNIIYTYFLLAIGFRTIHKVPKVRPDHRIATSSPDIRPLQLDQETSPLVCSPTKT